MYHFPVFRAASAPHRRIAFFLALCLFFASLSSCSVGTQSGGETTDGASAEESTAEPPAQSDSGHETTDPSGGSEPPTPDTETRTLSKAEIGCTVCFAKAENAAIADVTVTETGDVTLVAHSTGETAVTLTNTYGETVTVTLTVTDALTFSGVRFTPYTRPENSVVATDYGMHPANTDNAPALQAAINALPKTGGTVYVPAGRYISSFVELKANVTLRLEGVLPNYNTAFDDTLARRIENGDGIAVIAAKGRDMFANHAPKARGESGADNITITGGAFDMNGISRCFIWCCGDNIVLENTVMKDCPNNHAIQIAGCTGTVVRNVMFAGYFLDSNKTSAELIQIETANSKAIGAGSVSDSQFDENEIYRTENVTIENCYFGKSDEYDAPTFPIGHHGQGGGPSAVGVRILGCTFDNPRVVAIRTFAYSDVEIADCTFLSDRNNSAVGATRHMIEISLNTGTTLVNGTYLATSSTFGGCNGYKIHNNRFLIGKDSAFVGIVKNLKSGITDYDYKAEADILVTDFYTHPATRFTGYEKVDCRVSDIRFYENEIHVENTLGNCLYHFSNVKGLLIENNTLITERTYGAQYHGGEKLIGAILLDCTTPSESARECRILATAENKTVPIRLLGADTEISAFCTADAARSTAMLRVTASVGGTLTHEAEDGTLTLRAVPDEGYVFVGYAVKDVPLGGNRFEFSENTTLTAVFRKA